MTRLSDDTEVVLIAERIFTSRMLKKDSESIRKAIRSMLEQYESDTVHIKSDDRDIIIKPKTSTETNNGMVKENGFGKEYAYAERSKSKLNKRQDLQ